MYRDLKVKSLVFFFFKTQYKLLALELQAANSVEFSLREELGGRGGKGEGRASVSCTGVYSSAKIVFCLFSFPDMKGVTRKPPLFPPPPPLSLQSLHLRRIRFFSHVQ